MVLIITVLVVIMIMVLVLVVIMMMVVVVVMRANIVLVLSTVCVFNSTPKWDLCCKDLFTLTINHIQLFPQNVWPHRLNAVKKSNLQ